MARKLRVLLANGWGDEVESPSMEQMRAFLEDADPMDLEHGDVSLELTDRTSDSLISLDIFRRCKSAILEWTDGRLVFTVNGRRPRHLKNVPKEDVLRLWTLLGANRMADVERVAWLEGDGDLPPEEKDALIKKGELELARRFYDSLGDERIHTPCKKPDCKRGAVELSVFCRPHHYASVVRERCPFDD